MRKHKLKQEAKRRQGWALAISDVAQPLSHQPDRIGADQKAKAAARKSQQMLLAKNWRFDAHGWWCIKDIEGCLLSWSCYSRIWLKLFEHLWIYEYSCRWSLHMMLYVEVWIRHVLRGTCTISKLFSRSTLGRPTTPGGRWSDREIIAERAACFGHVWCDMMYIVYRCI